MDLLFSDSLKYNIYMGIANKKNINNNLLILYFFSYYITYSII